MLEDCRRRWSALLLALAVGALLSGCILVPGTFASTLEVKREGTFSFTYEGEIQTLALTRLAELAAREVAEPFEPVCHTEKTLEETACSEEQIAEQRSAWEAARESELAEAASSAEMMKAMLAGVDPSSPQAAQEFAALLARQKGWDRVEYRGDGLFDVAVRIEGRLDHGFVFPLVEKMPNLAPFVTVILRDDNRLRIDAPGFAEQSQSNPLSGSMAGLSGLAAAAAMAGEEGEEGAAPFAPVRLEGTFRIVTDGEILANNTDEGPAAHPRGQALDWQVSTRTTQAPTALIAFD